MNLTRRQFIERAGAALLALGVSPLTLDRHATVLAATEGKKFALLVGIDRYGGDSLDLKGASTDVELQKLLLQYRFGFPAENILVLTGEKATREGIEAAFQEHLIDRAGPDDTVVFHFSGHGARIDGDRDCLIPIDGPENAILLDTLLLLARCLPTDRVILTIDAGFHPADRPRSGNLRCRSYPDPPKAIAGTELAFQDALKQRYKLQKNAAPGFLLTATTPERLAVELSGNGWNAGLFTYALTSYLWSATLPDGGAIAFKRSIETVAGLMGSEQEPKLARGKKKIFFYNTNPEKSIGGEGIVTDRIDDAAIGVTLTGLPLEVLENYGINSCLAFRAPDGTEIAAALLSRQGLTARAKLLSPADSLTVGQVLQEKSRVFLAKIGLIVALDSNLSRIERVEAIGAFASLPDVAAVVNVGERRVDCLLSRVGDDESASYHLLSPNGSLIFGSLGAGSEAVKTGVRRLEPLLSTLLALKLWRLLVNDGSSRVAAGVTLEIVDKGPIARRDTGRENSDRPPLGIKETDTIDTLEIGTAIRYRIQNRESTPLYAMILGVDNERNPVLVCAASEPPEDSPTIARRFIPFLVQPSEDSIVPSSPTVTWTTIGPAGLVENVVILSRNPLEKTFAILNNTRPIAGETEQFLPLKEPLQVARALWEDLRVSIELKIDSSGNPIDDYAFDVRTWAGLRFIYEVVPGTR